MTVGFACTGLAALFCLAGAVVMVVRRRVFVVTVRGTSMEPTFRPGDRVLARRAGLAGVGVGDVVIIGARTPPGRVLARASFRGHPANTMPDAAGGSWIIKRVAAIPGDPVPRDRIAALAHVRESVVPDGKLVILGDSTRSADSRQHGYYDGNQVAGVVVRRLRGTSETPSVSE